MSRLMEGKVVSTESIPYSFYSSTTKGPTPPGNTPNTANMRFAIILACAALSTAAAVNPLVKRRDCEENCRGTFDANGGGTCGDVDECITNYCGCIDEGKDVSRSTV
jgi:hypothetical protein